MGEGKELDLVALVELELTTFKVHLSVVAKLQLNGATIGRPTIQCRGRYRFPLFRIQLLLINLSQKRRTRERTVTQPRVILTQPTGPNAKREKQNKKNEVNKVPVRFLLSCSPREGTAIWTEIWPQCFGYGK